MPTVRSVEGDTVDLILHRRFGRTDEALVRLVLEANPGVPALGPVLPLGTVLHIPDAAPAATTRATVRLWD